MLLRAVAGCVAAVVITGVARRVGALSSSGAMAAVFVGTAAVAAGWSWAVVLLLYFASSILLTRMGAAPKARASASIVAKDGPRDAMQVLANGGVFAVGALMVGALPASASGIVATGAVAALAASAADSWATEVGTLVGGTPRSLRTFRDVPIGTSGGVTAAGTLAMVAGACFVAVAARAAGLPTSLVVITAGGVAGAVADSALGETVQERRWCGGCERATERRVHDCGLTTMHIGGLGWLDNDVVNVACTLVGAAVGAALVT